MEVLRGEIRQGESIFARMYGPDFQFHFRAEYCEVNPDRLVYKQVFCDENGQIIRHPHAPLFPLTLRTTVDFTAENANCTRVTVSMEPYGPTTQEEVDFMINERGGMTKGWTGSFDKLEEILSGSTS